MIDKVWLFDINKRVYAKDESGRNTGGPIWREHWREHQVVDENRASYITKNGLKVSKNGGKGIAFSTDEIDRLEMVEVHAIQIAEEVRYCRNPDLLIEVARLIGYQCRQTSEIAGAAESSSDPLSQPTSDNSCPALK